MKSLIAAILAGNTDNTFCNSLDEARAELSDAAVNTLREHRDSMGWTDAGVTTMIVEEHARIKAGGLDLRGYCRARRVGSAYRLSRKARVAVFGQLVAKNLI